MSAGSRRLLVALVSVTALLVSACSQSGNIDDELAEPNPIEFLDADAFAAFLEENPDLDLINVHVPYEGHIEGTDAFVDFREILNFEDLPKDLAKPIVLYCRSGNMSGQAATELADAGYSNIIDLSGGMNAWTASGRTLLRDGPD